MREIAPPGHVRMGDEDWPFWHSVISEFAKSEWTDHLLELAAMLATQAAAQRPQVNPFSQQLQRLPDLQRRAAMRRAVLDSRQYCRTVEMAERRGPFKNLDMWVVRCDRGADYATFLGLDGSVQVRPCRDLAELKLPPCRLPPRPAAPARPSPRRG